MSPFSPAAARAKPGCLGRRSADPKLQNNNLLFLCIAGGGGSFQMGSVFHCGFFPTMRLGWGEIGGESLSPFLTFVDLGTLPIRSRVE